MYMTPLSYVLMVVQPVLALAALAWSLLLWRRRSPVVVLVLVWSTAALVNQGLSLALFWLNRTLGLQGYQFLMQGVPYVSMGLQTLVWITVFWALWTTARAPRQ